MSTENQNQNVDKTVKTRIAKLPTGTLQKKLQEGAFNEAEMIAAKQVLEGRGVDVPKPEKKTTGKKEGGEKTAAPKKKSEKIGDTKSDKMRVMLKAGKTTRQIIDAFEADGIIVRYPEIRRNRLWLMEKEQWVDPHAPKEGEEKPVKEKKPATKKADPGDAEPVPAKKAAAPKKAVEKKAAPAKKAAAKKA